MFCGVGDLSSFAVLSRPRYELETPSRPPSRAGDRAFGSRSLCMIHVGHSAIALAACALIACGGSSGNTDLYGAPGGGGDAGTGGVDGSGVDSARPGSDSGGRDATNDVSPGIDSGPTDPGIHCGASECTVGAQVCCRVTGLAGSSFGCTNVNSCNGGERLPIPCDDAADCQAMGTGLVCCATYQVNTATQLATVVSVSCASSSECVSKNNEVIVCDPTAPDACPQGGTCKPSQQTMPGYNLCL
jgi:hypothetical protein